MGGLTPEGGRVPRRGRTCSRMEVSGSPGRGWGLQGFQRKGPRACRVWTAPRQPRPPVLPTTSPAHSPLTDPQPGKDSKACCTGRGQCLRRGRGPGPSAQTPWQVPPPLAGSPSSAGAPGLLSR